MHLGLPHFGIARKDIGGRDKNQDFVRTWFGNRNSGLLQNLGSAIIGPDGSLHAALISD
jgi:hypothetical protein